MTFYIDCNLRSEENGGFAASLGAGEASYPEQHLKAAFDPHGCFVTLLLVCLQQDTCNVLVFVGWAAGDASHLCGSCDSPIIPKQLRKARRTLAPPGSSSLCSCFWKRCFTRFHVLTDIFILFLTEGDVVKYSCLPGYTLVGKAALACQLNSHLLFEAPPPTCQGNVPVRIQVPDVSG